MNGQPVDSNRFMRIVIFCVLALLSAAGLSAENRFRIDTLRTVLQVRRPAKEPVKSLDLSPAGAIDTLDTANEHIKVILLSDNTPHRFFDF